MDDGPGLGDLLSLGMTFAGCVVVGFGLGWWADQPFRTFPAFALVGLALGVVVAGAFFYQLVKRYK